MKFAPLENKLFAKALAEYEQDELMIPNSDALKTLLKLSSPSCSLIFLREANACTAPDKVNPKISAQKVWNNIHQASTNPATIILASSNFHGLYLSIFHEFSATVIQVRLPLYQMRQDH